MNETATPSTAHAAETEDKRAARWAAQRTGEPDNFRETENAAAASGDDDALWAEVEAVRHDGYRLGERFQRLQGRAIASIVALLKREGTGLAAYLTRHGVADNGDEPERRLLFYMGEGLRGPELTEAIAVTRLICDEGIVGAAGVAAFLKTGGGVDKIYRDRCARHQKNPRPKKTRETAQTLREEQAAPVSHVTPMVVSPVKPKPGFRGGDIASQAGVEEDDDASGPLSLDEIDQSLRDGPPQGRQMPSGQAIPMPPPPVVQVEPPPVVKEVAPIPPQPPPIIGANDYAALVAALARAEAERDQSKSDAKNARDNQNAAEDRARDANEKLNLARVKAVNFHNALRKMAEPHGESDHHYFSTADKLDEIMEAGMKLALHLINLAAKGSLDEMMASTTEEDI